MVLYEKLHLTMLGLLRIVAIKALFKKGLSIKNFFNILE
jgi:hypothetical protein